MGVIYEIWLYEILGVYYWYVKMPRCGCVEHGLEYIMFHVQQGKNIKIVLKITYLKFHFNLPGANQ